jgi:hypothetical protein
MCNNCRRFANVTEFRSADAFRDHVDQVRHEVAAGRLMFESGNVELNSIQRGRPFPDDFIDLTFACPTCHRRFSLGGVVYSGRDVKWQPV